MRIAIIQSNYLPWKGYFDIIHSADTFVFLEDVQYTKHDWRNRNRIKTPGGIKWISVPVFGSTRQKIFEVRIDNSRRWQELHKKMLKHSYGRCEFYHSYNTDIFEIFSKTFDTLSELNIFCIKKISGILGISTDFVTSTELNAKGKKGDRLLEICSILGADEYISGPAGRNYLEEKDFSDSNVRLTYFDYPQYPEYPQLWGEFDHFVSVVDLIFNCGERAPEYIWERV